MNFYLNRALLILLSWAVVVADGHQTQDSKKGIPAISRDALKAVVLIVVSDSSGKEIKQGSGVVVSSDGKVVTNFHVIDGAGSAVIKFPSGAFYLVEGVLAADKQKDVAVLKASGTDFPFILLGDSDKVEIGEEVISIGSPLSLEATVSSGIISSVRDLKEENLRLFQTTAPISHGSSGGALLNMRGEVIGITTAQLTGGQNLNFAVPINIAKPLLTANSAKKFGETARKEDVANTNPSEIPDLWTSMMTGHDYKVRVDANHVYLEGIFPPAFQKFAEQGAFIRCDLAQQGSKWVGSCVSYLPYQWNSKWFGNQTSWCRRQAKEEITLLTPSRIEGDAETSKDFDASKCTVKTTTMNHFVWIPKK